MNQLNEDRPGGPANPFEGFLLAVCVLQGFMVLSEYARPTSIVNLLPHSFVVLWSALLMFGGLVAVAGLYWPGSPYTGAEVKRVGLIAAGFASLAYGVALIGFGAQAYVASATSLAFATACFWRLRQVTIALRWARAQFHGMVRVEKAPPECVDSNDTAEEPGGVAKAEEPGRADFVEAEEG